MNVQEIKTAIQNIKRTAFGVSIPELRKLAQKVARENPDDFIKKNPNDTFELRLLHAFLLGYLKKDINELLVHFKNFMPYVNDWAINDSLCQNFTVSRRHQEEVWQFLSAYHHSTDEFESRIVSVMLLSHFLNDRYIDKVLLVLNRLNTDKYYAQMGVAWALATVMGKYPEKCLSYLTSKDCRLDKKTYNKTLQKIRESFRVSEEIKARTKTLAKH